MIGRLLREGLLGAWQRKARGRRITLALRDVAALAVRAARRPSLTELIEAGLRHEFRQSPRNTSPRCIVTGVPIAVGAALARHWRDPDTRVTLGCLALLALWVLAR